MSDTLNEQISNIPNDHVGFITSPKWKGEVVSGISLPSDHLERVEGWGVSTSSAGYVFRPSTLEALYEVFALARRTGRSVGFRGAGRSYGDASLNSENIVLDLTRMNRILDWNPTTGIIKVESGVTIKQLWEYILPDGWWPAVVPGTMFPTIGGCASMNIHGKNNFVAGPIGDHILEFELLSPEGELFRCSREENSEIFRSAIGGFGMLGCFTSITLKTKRIWSGLLEVEAVNIPNLDAMFTCFEERLNGADYLVGWIDAFGSGKGLGRGVVHEANYLERGVDPDPAQTLRIENQQLPDTILGLLPKSILWKFMRFFTNNVGVRFVNLAKFWSSKLLDRGGTFRQSHAAFAFLLDYVPNWKKSYGKGGLIQYQSFVPKETARHVFRAQLELCQKRGFPSYLAVFKRHRADEFPMSHALDGYSLALDFKVTRKNRDKIWRLASEMNRLVLDGGGRFYFAKDSTLKPEDAREFLGDKTLADFVLLKQRLDPRGILETDLAKRLFGSK
ncbi:MAG: FAD-binding oxidoreductase [Candidatus Kapaibacterium sp.]